MNRSQNSDEKRAMKGKEMVAYMLKLGTNDRGVISAKQGLSEPQLGHEKSSDLRSFQGVKGQKQIGESGVNLGDGADQYKAKGSTSHELTKTQYKQDQIDHQIIVNSTIIQKTTEEGICDQRVPEIQKGSLYYWADSESAIVNKDSFKDNL